jgi:non-hemolytic enterotoxin B/C
MAKDKIIEFPNEIGRKAKEQSSQVLIIRSYCLSITRQPKVNFSEMAGRTGGDKIIAIGKEINKTLELAQAHANEYMDVTEAMIVRNYKSINSYWSLQQVVPVALPKGSTEAQWLKTLTTLAEQAKKQEEQATLVGKALGDLRTKLGDDSSSMKELVLKLNALVEGNEGAIAGFQDDIDDIQSKIDGCIAGIVASGLAIVGGMFMIAIGSVATLVTGGTSGTLVAGGVAVVLGGVGGTIAASLTLKSLSDAKSKAMTSKADLEANVKLAQGVASSFDGYATGCNRAQEAAQQMKTAWEGLGGNLQAIHDQVKNGVVNEDAVRDMFLLAANETVKGAKKDLDLIGSQLTGAPNLEAPVGTLIGDYQFELTKQNAV